MPKLNHTGPEGEGPKTGRKLGKCENTGEEKGNTGELGIGLGKHFHEPKAIGKGRRLKYNKKR